MAQLQELQSQGLLNRADIRTMRKDIKKLRELDAASVGQVPAPAPAPQAVKPFKAPAPVKIEITSPKPVTPPESPQEKAFEQIARQDNEKMAQAKQYATEAEKQQIFRLEGQANEIKNQIQAIGAQKGSLLSLEKNQIGIKQQQQKKILEGIIQEENKVDQEIAALENKEGAITIPSEKQRLEKERGDKENQRQTIEKKRWVVEQEISKLEGAMKNLDGNARESKEEQAILTAKLAGVDNSLRRIYFAIIERQNKKTREAKIVQAPAPKLIAPKPMPAPIALPKEKTYLKDIPAPAKEKLVQTASTENEQRRRFMEDVEAWIKSSENNNQRSE